MTLRVVTGTANPILAEGVAAAAGTTLTACEVERFPDGEVRPHVHEVRGDDVYVVAPTGPPVNDHLVELLLLVDACRRAGAGRITAVVPYYGYARQDRRARAGDPVGARVVADALAAVGVDRLVVVDPHTMALEALAPLGVETLTAVPVLAAGVAGVVADDAVVVAPDFGAVKLAQRYGALLGDPVAIVHKVRTGGATVEVEGLVGDVAGRPIVVIDDLISTGGTIEAAVETALAGGARDDVVVAATHGVLVDDAVERVTAGGRRPLLVTDTLPPPPGVQACSVAGLLGDAIARLHADQPLDDLRPAA